MQALFSSPILSRAVRVLACACAIALLAGCHRRPPPASTNGPVPQRGYLWQRDWTPSVAEAVIEADRRLDGVVILGAEIGWSGTSIRTIRTSVDWKVLRAGGKPCAIALRVAPY